jgi:hypothetical protein
LTSHYISFGPSHRRQKEIVYSCCLKGPDKWRLVPDLWLINEAVISCHPVVPNAYTLLAQIPSKTQYYSVLDLKEAFFYIPLHPDSQPLFAFKDPTNTSQQQASQFVVLLEQHGAGFLGHYLWLAPFLCSF